MSQPFITNPTIFDSITVNYINRLNSKPIFEHQILINDFVTSTKDILLKADVVYLMNINDSDDSLKNLVKNEHNGTIIGTGFTFDTYWGFSNPNGDTYINTNYNPSTQGVNYTLNDAGFCVYVTGKNSFTSNTTPISCFQSSSIRSYMGWSISLGAIGVIVNDNTADNVYNTPFANGLFGISRINSTQKNIKNQNIVTSGFIRSSTALPNNTFNLFRYTDNNPYPFYGSINFTYIGSSLSDEEHLTLNNAVNEYLIKCLFLKYGNDNWGVKMAKSYFYDLHNFEKYEAFEVYEFIKRHQPDYIPERIVNSGNADTTDWVDSDGDGLADYFTIFGDLTPTIVTGNGFNGNAQRFECNNSGNTHYVVSQTYLEMGVNEYILSFKYRSNVQWSIGNFLYVNNIPVNTGDAVEVSYRLTSLEAVVPSSFRLFYETSGQIGSWIEIDELSLKLTTNYEYNTFSGKTVADYIMLFKAGGNLISRSWIKSGSYLRWNLDGKVYNTNALPSYTRGGNLGIVTVTSIDGWNGVTRILLTQTTNNVNSFYGNMPKFVGTLKTGGSKAELYLPSNRMKIDLRNQPLSLLSLMYLIQTNTGYNKLNISDLVGGSYTLVYVMGKRYNPNGNVIGDVSLLTNEITRDFYIRHDYDIYGHFYNYNTSTLVNFYADFTSVSGGFSTWSNTISICSFSGCVFDTTAVDDQLRVVNNYYSIATPIKDLSLNLGGSTMGIPTDGSNNVDLLGIISKYALAGFTANITIRTF